MRIAIGSDHAGFPLKESLTVYITDYVDMLRALSRAERQSA
jgi:ribose 5-phosphate isomerase RpiB